MLLMVFISEAEVIGLACWTPHGPLCCSPAEVRHELRIASISLTSQTYTVKSQDVFSTPYVPNAAIGHLDGVKK